MQFGVGVLGATGYIGTPYREEIRGSGESARIVALCARRIDRLRKAAQTDGAALATANWTEVVDHPDVNVVLVATPDALHHEAVMYCARHSKHVICEKPLGSDSGQAYEMLAAVRQAGLAHFVPFWTRYVPVFERAKQHISDGLLGDVRVIIYRWHNPRPDDIPFTWRDDASLSAAGSVADVGSHAYDSVRWLLGKEAKRVLAHADVISPEKPDLGPIDLEEALQWGQSHIKDDADSRRKGTAFDYASLSWEFEGGIVGSMVLSHAPVIRKGLSPEIELHGTKASMSIDRINSRLTLVRPDSEPEEFESVPNPGFGNRFQKHVFPGLQRMIDGEATDHPDLEDGWRVQVFTDAVVRSAKERTWIDLADLLPASVEK